MKLKTGFMNPPSANTELAGQSSTGFASSFFNRFSKFASSFTGHPVAFCLAMMVIVVWGITGPFFQYSDTWQLVINTGTTIVTFLMVFLIQNTQNRDMAATHIKLDELIRSHKKADNQLLDLEELDEAMLEKIRQQYERMASDARKARQQRSLFTDPNEGIGE